MANFVIADTTPVEIWLRRSDGGWSQFDLSGRLRQRFDPCQQDVLLEWVLGHAKVSKQTGDQLPD